MHTLDDTLILEQEYRKRGLRVHTLEDLLNIPLTAPNYHVRCVPDFGHNLPQPDFDAMGKKAWNMGVYLGRTRRGWKPKMNTRWDRFRFNLHMWLIEYKVVI